MRVVINATHGGFGLSQVAVEKLAEWGHPLAIEELKWRRRLADGTIEEWLPVAGEATLTEAEMLRIEDIARDDPMLLRAIDELGAAAAGGGASLKVVDIPDGVDWEIQEYDGKEKVVEKHRSWC